MAEKESQTASSKLNNFIEKNRTIFTTLMVVILCALVGYIVATVILNKEKNKNLEAIDVISFELTDGSNGLSEEEISKRVADAMEKLEPYTKKSGIAGARANMLCADVTLKQKKYEESIQYWKATANKAKNSYLAPIAYYNMGVCCEQLNKIEEAAANYKLAADDSNFVLQARAKFSYGRVLESLGKYQEAVTVYNEINDKTPNDVFAKLSKSRILILQAEGKAE